MRRRRRDFLDRTGEKHTTNEGYYIEIIEYFGMYNCTVKFDNGLILKNIQFGHVVRGCIKNPYHPVVSGVGFLGIGDYYASDNGKTNRTYTTWQRMLERCYDEKYRLKFKTYKDCSVRSDWHCFQDFAKFFIENYVDGHHLDKDILIKGNKVYSSDTCCFVPQEINSLFTLSNKARGDYPIGVSYVKASKKFKATVNINGNNKHLGYHKTPELAFLAYKEAKESYIKEMANKYKDEITIECYDALMNYEVEITD